MTFPLVVADGTPAEIGARYGEQAADLVAGNLDDYRRKFADVGLDAAEATRLGDRFAETTREYVPRIADMLDALAEGAGLARGDVYALNARTELMLPAGNALSECTCVAVLPEHVASGSTLLAQNWDWYPSQLPYTLMLATRDETGHAVLALAEAGMLAKTGLSSAGVGVCVNLLHSDLDGAPGGVPYHVLIRAALEARGISPALKVTALPRSASINLMLAVAGGTALDLELAPGLTGRVLPVDGLVAHANHFVSGIACRDAFYDTGGSSLFRDARARQLLERRAADRKVTVDDLMTTLQDHLGYPYAICRHVEPSDPPELQSVSAASIVMDLDEQQLWVSAGPPCEAPYTRYDLAALFDGI